MKISIQTKCGQVKKYILDMIKSYPPNSRIMSEPELSQKLTVSRVTIAKALAELVADGVVYREQGRGTFTASPSSTLKTGHIGCLVSSYPHPVMENAFYSKIYSAIEEEAREQELDVLLQSVHERSGVDFIMPSLIDRKKVDGILLVGEINKEIAEKIEQFRLPCVMIDNFYEDVNLHYVKTDNLDGAETAVDYLVGLGHKKIAFIGGPLIRNSFKDRYLGYQDALKKHGLKTVREYEAFGSEKSGYDQALELFKLKNRPTAISTGNDAIALTVLEAAKKLGLSIPGDISIVGFDDIGPAAVSEPPLTTLAVDKEKMGKSSVKMLKKIILGNMDIKDLVLPTRFIGRKSCGRVEK